MARWILKRLLQTLGELELRTSLLILEISHIQILRCLKFRRVKIEACERHVNKLHQSRYILGNGSSRERTVIVWQIHVYRCLLSGHVLLKVGRSISTEPCRGQCHRQVTEIKIIVAAIAGCTTLRYSSEYHLVILEVSMFYNDSGAVGESPHYSTELFVISGAHDFAGLGQLGDERLALYFIHISLDILGSHPFHGIGKLRLCRYDKLAVVRQHGKYHDIAVRHKLCHSHVKSLNRYLIGKHAHYLILVFYAGYRLVVNKIAHIAHHQRSGCSRIAVLVSVFKLWQVFAACTSVFRGCKTASLGAETLAVYGLKSRHKVIALRYTEQIKRILGLGEQITVIGRRDSKRSVRLWHHVIEARTEHALDHVHGIKLDKIVKITLQRVGTHIAAEHYLHYSTVLLLILADSKDRLLVVADGIILAFFRIFRHLDVREYLLYLSLNAVNIYITDHDYTLLIGTIPCLIIITKRLIWEIINHLQRAYRHTIRILTAGIHNRQKGLKYALLAHIAATPLFMNDCTLFVDLLRVKQQSVGPVMKYKQTRILNWLAGGRYLTYIIYCLVDRGIGVEVAAEFHAHGLKPRHNVVAREVIGAVEAHVFKEVSESALIVFFKNWPYFLCDVIVGLILWILIVTDVIRQAVVKTPYPHIGIDRNRGHLLRLSGRRRRCHQNEKQQHSIKILSHC